MESIDFKFTRILCLCYDTFLSYYLLGTMSRDSSHYWVLFAQG